MKFRVMFVLSIVVPSTVSLSSGEAKAAEFDFSSQDGLNVRFENGVKFSSGIVLQRDSVVFDDSVTTLDNDSEFRRARIKTALDWSDWRLRAAYDFRISEGWKSTYVQYTGFRKQRITVGNHVAPFSMEVLSSSSTMPLMERSIGSTIVPGLLFGASYRTWRDRWSMQVGVYGDELSNLDSRSLPGRSAVGRFTFAPIHGDGSTLHLGVAIERRIVDDGQTVRLRSRPGTRLTDRRLVDTRSIEGVDDSTSVGIEFAAAYKRFRVQSELNRTTLDTIDGDARFNSGYVLASVALNGEAYDYSHSRGVFRGASSDRPWGAFELTARSARLDLSDGPISGGVQHESTFGLSWTMNEHFALMLNYSDIDATPNRNGVDEDVSLWMLRFQLGI